MSLYEQQWQMLVEVAQALGPELRQKVVFVGGCTTGLLVTDEYTREQVRATNDVDLIVSVAGYASWQRLKEQLQRRGFREPSPADEAMPICAMKLGGLRVDLMPDTEAVLGFSNDWYARAVATAWRCAMDGDLSINVVTPPLFLATKLVAYRGRGEDD